MVFKTILVFFRLQDLDLRGQQLKDSEALARGAVSSGKELFIQVSLLAVAD